MNVLIVGGGIGGLTLALALHHQDPTHKIKIFDAVPEFRALGLGINLLPHAIRVLDQLGLRKALASVAVEPQELTFFTHLGQLVHREPCGLFAGYDYPHYSIHRGDLHKLLYDAVCERIGQDAVCKNHRFVHFVQTANGVTAEFVDRENRSIGAHAGDVLIGCDGINSAVRSRLYPDEGAPVFHGINMWRGAVKMKPFLTGASVTRIGALFLTGKLAVYPIRNNIDAEGNQLVNWIAEVVTDNESPCDWSSAGRLEDFYPIFQDWKFDWLDCSALLRNTETVLSYPMVDRDPVSHWSFGRVSLLGDAAHPMYPRGGNGGAQSIIDAKTLAQKLQSNKDPIVALLEYEVERLKAVNTLVLKNRIAPPDSIIELVEQRTGGKAFQHVEDVISLEEISAIHEGYQRVAGYDKQSVSRP